MGHANGHVLPVALLLLVAAALHVPTATAQVKTAPLIPHIRNFVDADGNPASDFSSPLDPDTLVYGINSDPPGAVLGPDGHHYTLGEIQQVSGVAQIERLPNDEGTQLTIDVTGLIPNGVYTVWGAYFTDTRFNYDPLLPNFPDNVAIGSIGANDGSEARFDADANGTATFTAVIPPGPLSIAGEAPPYVLDGYSDFAFVGVYHIDGQTYGTVPGPNHVGHFFAGFSIPEPSSVLLGLIAGSGFVAATLVLRRRKRPLNHRAAV